MLYFGALIKNLFKSYTNIFTFTIFKLVIGRQLLSLSVLSYKGLAGCYRQIYCDKLVVGGLLPAELLR